MKGRKNGFYCIFTSFIGPFVFMVVPSSGWVLRVRVPGLRDTPCAPSTMQMGVQHKILDGHKEVKTKRGKGSEFSCTFPLLHFSSFFALFYFLTLFFVSLRFWYSLFVSFNVLFPLFYFFMYKDCACVYVRSPFPNGLFTYFVLVLSAKKGGVGFPGRETRSGTVPNRWDF